MKKMIYVTVVLSAVFAASVLAQDATPYSMSPDEVRLVQKKLYELNYDPGPVDGVLTERTRSEIARWQETSKRPSTGSLTKEEFDYLANIDTSRWVWASIAGSTDGISFAVWNQNSRAESEAQVLPDCRRRSSEPNQCRVSSMSSSASEQEGWIAFVLCTRREGHGERVSMTVDGGRSRSGTIDGAYEYLTSKGFSRSNCTVKAVVETRGRHK